MLFLGDLLLRGLYAFYTEHERCGELEGGVEGEWAGKEYGRWMNMVAS
jgi:hypothetical protein